MLRKVNLWEIPEIELSNLVALIRPRLDAITTFDGSMLRNDDAADYYAVLEIVQRQAYGALCVIIQSRVEADLRTTYEQCGGSFGPKEKVSLGVLIQAYLQTFGVHLDRCPWSRWRIALYHLANSYKHQDGWTKDPIKLPGHKAMLGRVDYRSLPYDEIVLRIRQFLTHVREKTKVKAKQRQIIGSAVVGPHK